MYVQFPSSVMVTTKSDDLHKVRNRTIKQTWWVRHRLSWPDFKLRNNWTCISKCRDHRFVYKRRSCSQGVMHVYALLASSVGDRPQTDTKAELSLSPSLSSSPKSWHKTPGKHTHHIRVAVVPREVVVRHHTRSQIDGDGALYPAKIGHIGLGVATAEGGREVADKGGHVVLTNSNQSHADQDHDDVPLEVGPICQVLNSDVIYRRKGIDVAEKFSRYHSSKACNLDQKTFHCLPECHTPI